MLVREIDPMTVLMDQPVGPYVPRDVDTRLDLAIARGGLVLVVHQHQSGARRTTYEALLRTLPDAEFVGASAMGSPAGDKAVAWLDSSAPLTKDGALNSQIQDFRKWLADGGHRCIVMFVYDSDYDDTRIQQAFEVLSPSVILVPNRLSKSEQRDAAKLFPGAESVRSVSQLAEVTQRGEQPARKQSDRAPDPYFAHAADYRPDTDEGVDQLGIGPDVRMLADLVVSRMITPPLSIGLFGSWGSGKSFFMRQMQLRVRELADSAQEAESAADRHGKAVSSYCSSVRQISFNAWHYSEANLLASLATHIFDNLAASGAENDLQRQADALAERRKAEKTLLGRLSAVRLERRTLTAQQKQAKRRRRKPRDYVRAVFDSLTDADKAWIAARLGVARSTAEDLERLAQETGGLRSDVAEFWRRLRQDPVPLLVLIGGLVTVLVVTLIADSTRLSGALGGLTVVTSALTAVLRMRASAGRIHQALDKLGGPSEDDQKTERRLAELDAETERLEKAVADLAPGLDLVSFAESRVSDYVEHLGVVSLLRKDLETFATMLAEVPYGSGKIERTVLYVDDLDRCPPKVVVQVLEAIHLLLALPVFVVVVGVDSRWLKKAIEQHYAEMLGEDPEMFAENYLEKIFQVPFTLSTMDESGFAGLVRGLAATEGLDATPAPDSVPAPPSNAAPPSAETTPEPPREPQPAPSSEPSTIDLRPPRLMISEAELEFLATLSSLVRSPRAAKRLLNLYRLLRARFAGDELAEFLSDGTREAPFRAVLVLLSVLVGHPEAARDLFATLGGADPDDAFLDSASSLNDHELRPKLERGLSGTSWPEQAASYQRWLPLVNRFSFSRDD